MCTGEDIGVCVCLFAFFVSTLAWQKFTFVLANWSSRITWFFLLFFSSLKSAMADMSSDDEDEDILIHRIKTKKEKVTVVLIQV